MKTRRATLARVSRLPGFISCAFLLGCEPTSQPATAQGSSESIIQGATQRRPRTALVGLRVSTGGRIEIAFVSPKETPFQPELLQSGDLEVVTLLEEQPFSVHAQLPLLCECGDEGTHSRGGDLERAHASLVVMKLPWLESTNAFSVRQRRAAGEWHEVLVWKQEAEDATRP